MRPIDPYLNAAILSIAAILFPDRFDVAEDAPATFKERKANLDAGKRLVVYSGGCEGTIYADPAVNHAFHCRQPRLSRLPSTTPSALGTSSPTGREA